MKKKLSTLFLLISFVVLFFAAKGAQAECPEGTGCTPPETIDDFRIPPPPPSPEPTDDPYDPCDPWIAPNPIPTPPPPPPTGPGDIGILPPPPTPTPPPVPNQPGDQITAPQNSDGMNPYDFGDCDEPEETPVPETPEPNPTPETDDEPEDPGKEIEETDPNAGFFLQGSGKLGCSLQASTASSWFNYLGFALFFLLPFVRRGN